MNVVFLAVFAAFGLIIGSFLNVLILRYNTGKGLGGWSECFSCGRRLTTRDLFPVLSFLFWRGRCRTCKSRISRQYVLVELATAFLFMLTYLHNAPLLSAAQAVQGMGFPIPTSAFIIKSIIDCMIMSLLVFMAGYDIRHKIIPDLAVFLFGGLALVGSILVPPMTLGAVGAGLSLWLLTSGPLLALPFYLIWLLSGGRWMGLGDAKLALGFGWMLGLSAGGTAVIFGFWIGAAYAVLVMILRPGISLRNKFAFWAFIAFLMIVESLYGAVHVSTVAMSVILLALLGCIGLSRTNFLRKMTRWGYLPALQMKSEVPFAPFLIIGLLIVYVLGYNLFIFGL
jgi:prepilin signal peptidase PulO-like enzyme (type II secretory pathway)